MHSFSALALNLFTSLHNALFIPNLTWTLQKSKRGNGWPSLKVKMVSSRYLWLADGQDVVLGRRELSYCVSRKCSKRVVMKRQLSEHRHAQTDRRALDRVSRWAYSLLSRGTNAGNGHPSPSVCSRSRGANVTPQRLLCLGHTWFVSI